MPDETESGSPEAPAEVENRNETGAPAFVRPEARRAAPGQRMRERLVAAAPYGVLIVFALAILIFSLLRPSVFPTLSNLESILTSQSILVVAALAVTIPLVSGQFDLSISGNIGFTGLIVAGLMSRMEVPWGAALVAGLILGLAIGLINGALVAYGGIHSFIVTLGTATLLTGFSLWYSGGQIIFSNISDEFTNLMRGDLLAIPLSIIYVVMVAGVVWFILAHTPLGRDLYAIGGSRSASEVAGVRVRRRIMYALALGGLLGGLAAVMLVSRGGSAQPGSGDTFLLPAFAGAFLGAATFGRGSFNVPGTVVGVYFLATLVSGAFVLGARSYVVFMISGSALILAVFLEAQRERGGSDARSGRLRGRGMSKEGSRNERLETAKRSG